MTAMSDAGLPWFVAFIALYGVVLLGVVPWWLERRERKGVDR